MNRNETPTIFTPSNEPYLGREMLFHFDEMISCCLEKNAEIAPQTHSIDLSELQKMACQVIPQSISIALSIRELIRQGYLFGGHVLARSFAERVSILLYLHYYPEKIQLWVDGWNHREAPSLSKMFEEISRQSNKEIKGFKMTAHLNSLVHGKPDSLLWNIVDMGDGNWGHAPSKILNRPKLCDELCVGVLPYLSIIVAMISAYFPEKNQMHNNGLHEDTQPR